MSVMRRFYEVVMDNKETFGGEIAKQLPIKEIYNDVAHPALSTVGEGLQGAVKIALAPISMMVWGYDSISEYLNRALPEYFEKRKISTEKIAPPDPSIAVPIIDAMRYTSHKDELKMMFTNLLGSSMNIDSIDEHPAFIEIIKQLSSDECKMIKYLRNHPTMPMIKIRVKNANGNGSYDIFPYFSDICYMVGCDYPHKFPEYLDNLHRLGLVEIHYDTYLTDDKVYEKLKTHPGFRRVGVSDDLKLEKKSIYCLSELAKKFCNVCLD